MKNRLFRLMLVPAAVLFSAACADLEVTNPNNPDIKRALAEPGDVVNIAKSSLNSWYLGVSDYDGAMMFQTTADATTSNYGNFGMRFNNEEPRIPYNNISASGDEPAARFPWQNSYAALGAANDALKAIANGVDLGADLEPAKAAALFTQAGALSHIALIFDKGFIVDENLEGLPEVKTYAEVRDAALAKWDALITLTAGKTWAWPADWFPLFDVPQATAPVINRMAKTMAARLLVLSARTPTENAATDWARVLGYANAGITGAGLPDMDLSLKDDGGILWYDYIKFFGAYDNWMRVDQRLINRMDPDIPARFNGVENQPVSTPNDNRLGVRVGVCTGNPTSCLAGVTTDYVDLRNVLGDPGRGIWMQSTFYHRRYRGVSGATPGAQRLGGELVYVLAADNDLMIAEALVRSGGSKVTAATLINKTRVTRGGLTVLTGGATNAELLAAIDYERDVELLNTNAVVMWADRRRLTSPMFNANTFRQLPIPARELEVLRLPNYTFGGPAGDM